MKWASWLLLAYSLALMSAAQDGGQAGFTAASRSAHETVWQRLEWTTNSQGRGAAWTNEFVEVATGLNYLSDETPQQWQPSREEWEVYADGIVARWGQHKAILSHNLADGVDVLLPDGATRLVATPVSLGFYDPVDGRQIVMAEVKPECMPERGAAPNEIVFRNCFDRIRGSIRFLYTKAGVHQHVVLEQKLELPEGFSEKSRLECYTVFAPGTPWPQIQTRVLRREKDPVLRALMVEPDFTDSELSFGSMAMQAGTAFSLRDEGDANSIRVGKQYQLISGLPTLIEGVEWKELEPLLSRLASVGQPNTGGLAINSSRQVKRAKEQARVPRELFRAWDKEKEIQLASSPLREPAVVIDYELLTSGTARLTGGTTWYVSGLVNVTNLVIEGTVVKFTNSISAKINVTGTIDCQTGPYRPAIFTSQYDTTVGESIGSGTLTNYPGALVINTTGNVLHDLRISYATNGVTLGFSAGQIQLANVQFVKCQYPIDSAGEEENNIVIDNGLFFCSQYVIRGGEDLVVSGRHLTINQCDKVGYTGFGSTTGDLYLTNSLVVAATNGWGQFDGVLGSVTTNHAAYYSTDPGGIFQTVGAGSHLSGKWEYESQRGHDQHQCGFVGCAEEENHLSACPDHDQFHREHNAFAASNARHGHT